MNRLSVENDIQSRKYVNQKKYILSKESLYS